MRDLVHTGGTLKRRATMFLALAMTFYLIGSCFGGTAFAAPGDEHDLTLYVRDAHTEEALSDVTFGLFTAGGAPVYIEQTGPGSYRPGGSQNTFTAPNGTAVIETLPEGGYRIDKTTVPNGYAPGDASTVTLDADANHIIDVQPTCMEVTVQDALTHAVMPNVTLALLNGSENPVPISKDADGTYRRAGSGGNTFTTDSAGKAVFLYFPNGTYRFKEVTPLPGYAELTGNSVTLNGAAAAELNCEPLTFALTKTDSYTGDTMQDVSFTLLGNDGNLVKFTQTANGVYRYDTAGSLSAFTTGTTGTASIHYIPVGDYVLRENGTVGTGYVIGKDSVVNVNIKSGVTSPAEMAYTNDPITLVFTKTDATEWNPLDGGVYRLINGSGDAVKLRQTGSGAYRPDGAAEATFTFVTVGGIATIRYLAPGAYTVEEVTPPDGYEKDENQSVTVTNENNADDPAQVHMAGGSLSLDFRKTDELTSRKMDGATFSLLNSAGNVVKLRKVRDGTYVIDSAGSDTFTTAIGAAAIFPVAPEANYTVTEVQPAPGYAVAADISVTGPGRVQMTDAPLALEVTDQDSLKQTPVSGGTFTLKNESGTVKVSPLAGRPGWYKPDDNGNESFAITGERAVIAYLPVGAYTLTRTKAPDGYVNGHESVNVSIGQAHTYRAPAVAAMRSEPLIAVVAVSDGQSMAPIEGVSFRVTDDEGEPMLFTETGAAEYTLSPTGAAVIHTGADGLAILRQLPTGDYVLIEESSPGFNRVTDTPFTVSGDNTPDAPAVIALTNFPLYLRLSYADERSGAALAGAAFRLLAANGEPLRFTKQTDGTYRVTGEGEESFTTDSDGKAVIAYIPAGEYTLGSQEYAGYGVVSNTSVEITEACLQAAPAVIELAGAPVTVEIRVTDGYSSTPLEGAAFKLTKDGKPVFLTLQENGAYYPAAAATTEENADTPKTDKEGRIRIEYLLLGEYTLLETAPSGYVAAAELAVKVESVHTAVEPLIVAITNLPIRFLLEKQHALTGEPLAGAKFSLKDENGKKTALVRGQNGVYQPAKEGETGTELFETDTSGQAVIAYLKPGKYVVTEEEAPEGFAVAKPVTTEVGTEKILLAGKGRAADTVLALSDAPFALKIAKVHAETKKPLQGATFQLKAAGAPSVPLRFTYKNGAYFYDRTGAVTDIGTDENAVAVLYDIPVGKYTLEESAAPKNFFAAAPMPVEITTSHTYVTPLSVTVENSPSVKLGFSNDKYNLVIGIAAIALGCGGAVAMFIFLWKRRKQQDKDVA